MATEKQKKEVSKRPSDTKDYKVGYERGYEKGYQDACQGKAPKYKVAEGNHRTVKK